MSVAMKKKSWQVFLQPEGSESLQEITGSEEGKLLAKQADCLYARGARAEVLNEVLLDWIAQQPSLQLDDCEVDVDDLRIVVYGHDYLNDREFDLSKFSSRTVTVDTEGALPLGEFLAALAATMPASPPPFRGRARRINDIIIFAAEWGIEESRARKDLMLAVRKGVLGFSLCGMDDVEIAEEIAHTWPEMPPTVVRSDCHGSRVVIETVDPEQEQEQESGSGTESANSPP